MNPMRRMSLIRLRRRRFFALAAAGTAGGAVTLGAGACSSPSTSSTTASSTPPVPDGWARTTAGHAAFTMPENCQQVPLPDDAPLGYWDWVAQDAPTLDDTSATYRIGVITQGPSAVFDNPPTDDTEFVARKLGVSSLFGRKMLSTGASPYQVEGIPDQLWRIDYFPIGGYQRRQELPLRRPGRRRTGDHRHRPERLDHHRGLPDHLHLRDRGPS